MSEQEYGYDTANMHFYTDETLTIEVDMSEISREEIEKVLGGVPIVRCKDCKHFHKAEPTKGDISNVSYCENEEDGLLSFPNEGDFCSRGKRREE